MKKNILILYLLFPLFITAQNWQQAGTFPYSGVHHPITFSFDQFAYVVTGSNTSNTYKYDKNTETWSQLADFPGGDRGYAYGVAVGSKAYMGFGSNSNGSYPVDWWEYDMINESWTQKANFPYSGRNHPAMISVGDKIYVGCGSNNTGNLGDWWEYNITTNSWSQKTDLPGNDRHHPFYFGIGNYAYVGFGHGSVPGPGSNPNAGSYIYNDFYRYNPSNDTWTQLSNFPSEARVAGTQFSYNNKGYVLSGDGDDHGPLSSGEFWEYNPSNDLWTQLNSHPGDAIWAPGNFVIGCDVYFLLGQNNNTFPSVYPENIYTYKLSDDCGCTDPLAVNYSVLATIDDGSCCYISGCTDPLALNYDSTACYDDNSCIAPILGCTNETASNYDPSANTLTAKGGALDNTFGTGGFFNGDQHLIFDVTKECIIKSAVVYAELNNTITFELRDNNAAVLQDTTITVFPGKQRINLEFNVTPGINYQLGINSGNSGLYRNNSNADYPYNIGSAINIKSSSASTSPLSYYYFFYDIIVESPCYDVTNISNISTRSSKIIKITDVLGREIEERKNTPLFYIYEDGKIVKRIIID